MQNKNEGKGPLYPGTVDVQQAPPVGLGDDRSNVQALSDEPLASPAPTAIETVATRPRAAWFKRWGMLVAVVALLTIASVFAAVNSSRRAAVPTSNNAAGRFDTTVLALSELQAQPEIELDEAKSVKINGDLNINGSMVLTPSAQPSVAQPGQIYYDIGTNVLAYFNGTEFVSVGGEVVEQISGLTGQIALGAGLSAAGGQIANSGVLSVQGQAGNVAFTGGSGISISGTTITNSGVVSVTSSSPSITVTDDGNGNITLGGSGSGTVSSTGGTTGRIAKFTGAQSIEDSLLSESGAIVTVNGNLNVTGGTTLGSALTVANGGTGATTLGTNGVLVGNGAAAITSVVAGGAGLCLVSTGGAPNWASCTNAGNAVTSLNGLSGSLTIANATGLVNTITIDDASTANKGIVQFNGTNFSVVGGVANTVQNINATASPTFSSQTLSGDLAVNGGDITSTGGLNITPAGTLTAGSTNQTLTLQGNASSVFTATNGASTTTMSFQAPTANVNYRFATAAAGNYDVCTTAGNCAGGGGVTGSGTVGTLPKFTGASAIGDSLISESGSTITVNGNLNLTAGNQYQINGTQISSANLSNNANLAKLDASQTFTGNNVAFQNASNSATAFAVQNALGNRVITVDTAAAELELGQGSTVGGRLVFSNATNANAITLVSAVAGANRTITLPDDTGTICLDTGNCAGAGAILQTSYNNSTDPEIVVDGTRGALTIRDNAVAIGANLFEVQNNAGGVTYFSVTSSGVSVTGTATASGNINSSGGSLQTNSVTRVDNSGNLANIGSLTLSGAISGGTTISGSGNINTTGGAIQTNSTSRIDNSGNLINIAAITASGNATLQGGSITLGTTSQAGSLILNDGSSNTGTLQVAALGQNTVYTLPDPVAGTVSICLTTGNCAGTGTGVTSISGGSANRLAKFTAAQNIEDSTITDNGTTVSTSADLVIQGGDVTVGVASSQTGTINFADSGSAFLGSIVQGALTGNRTYTLPNEGGEICLNSGNCLGPGGNGANIALSNLAGVAINTTLLPGAAGTINLGSGTLPFGDLFLAGSSGTPGANNFRITGASTGGTRTITLPNDSGTVCINTNNCNYAAASGSANYIQNQIASPQAADFNISGEGRAATFNATTGVNTGAGAGTQRIDASGNLANIGSLTLSGAISGGTTISGSGNINTTGGALQTNSTSRVDVSGNLVNIGNLTATGAITIASAGAGSDVIIDGADQFIVQDAAAFNGASVFSADVDLTLAEAENLNITNTITGGNSVNLINAVLTNNTTSGTQQIALLQNAAGTGTTVNLLVLDNADSDTAVTAGLVITSAAGGVGTGVDLSDADIGNALSVGANHIVGTTGNIDLSNFDVDGSNGNVTAGTYNGQTISATANLTGTLTVANNLTLTAGDIAVNGGNITSTGALSIDPTGSLTAGAVTQILTLQGNGGTTLSATDGVNTTTLAFTTPTADTTLNLPALSAGTYSICTSSGNCLGAGVTLQAAYNNSTTPEIVVNGTNGALTIRDDNPAIGANLLEVQNNAGSTTYFAVTSSGTSTTGTSVGSGNINTTGGALQTASIDRIDNSGNLVNIGNITASGTYNTNTFTSSALTFGASATAAIQSAASQALNITGHGTSDWTTDGGNLTIDATAAAAVLNLGTAAQAKTINLGTGAAAVQTINIGGTGANVISLGNSQTGGSISLGAAMTTGTINIGGTGAQTGTITLGGGTGAQTINLATGGTGAKTVTLGSTASTGSLTLQAGSGGITLGAATTVAAASPFTVNSGLTSLTGATSGDALNVSNSTSTGNIAVFSDNATAVATIADGGAATFQNSANSANAFRVLNGSSEEVLGADTVDSMLRLLANNSGRLQSFVADTDLPSARDGFGLVNINGNLLMLGGCDTTGTVTTTVQYAGVGNTGTVGAWSNATAALPNASCNNASTTYNGYVYVSGGTGVDGTSDDLYIAKTDTTGNVTSWSTAGVQLPNPVAHHSMVAYNGYLYVIGGRRTTDNANIRDLHYAKIHANGSIASFTTISNWLPEVRLNHSAFVANDRLYVTGGRSDLTASEQDEVYIAEINEDGSVDAASTDGDLIPASRYNHSSVVMNGYLYVIGGDGGGTINDDIYYAPINDDSTIGAFTTDSTLLPGNRSAGNAVVANGYVFYIGGDNGTDEQNNVWAASGARVTIGGSLDLVGYSGNHLNSGGTGGGLTAGNTHIAGTLNVTGNAVFMDGIHILNNVLIRPMNDDTGVFTITDSANLSHFSIDTLNSRIYIGNPSVDDEGAILILDRKTGSDPAGINGGMYHNSSTERMRCYEENRWTNCSSASREYDVMDVVDDFSSGLASASSSGQIGSQGWAVVGGNTIIAPVAGVQNHPGIINISSSTTSGSIASVMLFNTGSGSITAGDINYFGAIVRPASGTTTMSTRVGFLNSGVASGEAGQGVYFSFVPGTSANWRTVTRGAGGITSNTTGTAYSTSTWYRLEIKKNTSGNWEFYINGTLQFTHTTNFPADTLTVNPAVTIETNNTTAKTVDLDWARFRSDVINR